MVSRETDTDQKHFNGQIRYYFGCFFEGVIVFSRVGNEIPPLKQNSR